MGPSIYPEIRVPHTKCGQVSLPETPASFFPESLDRISQAVMVTRSV